jgi:hypothetical protein
MYLPDEIGWDKTRLFYIFGGTGLLIIGAAYSIHEWLSLDLTISFSISILLSVFYVAQLYKARNGSSVLSVIDKIRHKK